MYLCWLEVLLFMTNSGSRYPPLLCSMFVDLQKPRVVVYQR